MDTIKALSQVYLFSGSHRIWEQHVRIFRCFPLGYAAEFLIETPAGKTTLPNSLFNIPGKLGWITQELVAPICLITTLYKNSSNPWQTFTTLPTPNIILSVLYIIHYIHRALISPLRAPNLSPMHIGIWFVAIVWNYFNAYSLAGSLLLMFEDVNTETTGERWRFMAGILLWAVGFWGNIWHEGVLYEIRYRAKRDAQKNKKRDDDGGKGKKKIETEIIDGKERLRLRHTTTGQVYEIPEGGLFTYCWNPHYFCEWVEWTGFLIATGLHNKAAQNFLLNELTTMIPRTFQHRRWYKAKFGDKTPDRKAAIPFVI